ncbi:hypothetical protein Y032_0567g37 [Ancylostoma ceylanicum]|uniref:Uncharacterized protein n=1 Tax=Ancylostoma ceylanicum TaxID=53326 RepID=A0A016WR58_9BILA|nr:hypothetical protein Y032_0567g37 [Ancylostoma ceylanicum]
MESFSKQFVFQVLAKRYECSDVPSFVRKIYIARDKADDPRVNTHVAVLTYHWKSEPVIARANRDAVIARKRQAESGETAVVEGRADLDNIDLEPLRMKRPTSTNRFKVRAGQIVKPKALPMIDVLSRVRLSHTDHLRRLALTKKSENLCRLAAILDRAEPVLERFEQYFLTHCQDVRSFNSHETVWVEQHHLAGRRPMEKADQRGEECIIVDGGGEPIEVPPGCLQIVYESPSGSEAFS